MLSYFFLLLIECIQNFFNFLINFINICDFLLSSSLKIISWIWGRMDFRIILYIWCFFPEIWLISLTFIIILISIFIVIFISMFETSSIFITCINFIWLLTKPRKMIYSFVIYWSSECRNLFSALKFRIIISGSIIIIEFLLSFIWILLLLPRRITDMIGVSELQMHNW